MDWDVVFVCGVDYGFDLVFVIDVVWIDVQVVYFQFGDVQGDVIVEVDVGDQWYVDLLFDFVECFGGVYVGDGNLYDVCIGIFQVVDLCDGGSDVVGFGVGYVLYGDWCIVVYWDVVDLDFLRFVVNDWRSVMNVYCFIFRWVVLLWMKGVMFIGWLLQLIWVL